MEQEKKLRESIDENEEAQAFLKHEEEEHFGEAQDEEDHSTRHAPTSAPKGLSNRFWISAAVNTVSTAAIVSLLHILWLMALLTSHPGLHQQTHLPNRLSPPRPSHLRSLPLLHNVPPPLPCRSTRHQPLPSKKTRHLYTPPTRRSDDSQRRITQRLTRLFEYTILSSRSRTFDALCGGVEFYVVSTTDSKTGGLDACAGLLRGGGRFVL